MKKAIMIIISLCLATLLGGTASADITDNLVAYYPFNGNANDESGNGNHGTVYYAQPIEDHCGERFDFDGEASYVEILYSPQMEPTAFSLSLWFQTNMSSIGTMWSSDNADRKCTHGVNLLMEKGKVKFAVDRVGCGANGKRIFSNDRLNDGEWHHVVAIYKGKRQTNGRIKGDLEMYVDGAKQDDSKYGRYDPTGAIIRIGNKRRWAGGKQEVENKFFFEGIIDEVRLYSSVLSESEIEDLYDQGPCDVYDCACTDFDHDGVPDAWDYCPHTPPGSPVYSDGCAAY